MSFDFCFLKDGGRIASSDAAGVKLWALKTGALIRNVAARNGRVRIAPDASSLVVMAPDSAPEICDLSKDGGDRPLIGHYGGAIDAAYSSDGCLLVTAGYDHTVRLWDVNSAVLRGTFQGPSAPLRSIALSSDGTRVLAGGDDRCVRVWDLSSGREVLDLAARGGVVQACASHPTANLPSPADQTVL